MKVNFYIDGFNFYYGLKSKKWRKYYWLDVVRFCESFLRPGQELGEVFYCTAVPKNRGKQDRQDLFFSANRLNPKFKLVFGKFLEKRVLLNGNEFKTFEEKQTDVNIAVEMIRGVVMAKCDASVIVSADSDLIPPVRFIREFAPGHKIFVYFPPDRYSADLQHSADAVINLQRYETRFQRSLLPEIVELTNGTVIHRPPDWM